MIAFFFAVSKTEFFVWPSLILDMENGLTIELMFGPFGFGVQFGGEVG